ncbi:GTP-binding protein 10 homolog [Orussus abietinus]|uniref:GTP-binding protein 10 homolog n=1 Tax=Orussus abietinus TaxID=222816 RepID=UPI0006266013|nr:GTP-binding protein 10 homolog [Orussus abietinus]
MVFLTQILGYAPKPLRKFLRRGFMDSLRLHVKGGTGGMGLPRYGGKGGSGGDVYVVGKEKYSLPEVSGKCKKHRISAGSGSDSSAKGILGKSGQHAVIDVPSGVTVYDENGILLGEVNKPGDQLIVAKGGLGGCPETGFSGQRGQAHTIILDLKLIADVALVGFPNAGKSTLLRAISYAKPKVAEYPFTTVRPHIGTITYQDLRQITVADLPGLIEGAHMNVGMGHKFLKHVERTKLLLLVADIQGFQLSPRHNYRNCLETIVLLNKELELYKPDLLRRSALLVINKMDTKDADSIYKDIKSTLRQFPDFVSQCHEEIRPEKIIRFSHILPVAIAQKNPEEITNIKTHIRQALDVFEQEKEVSEQEVLKNKLKETLQREMRLHVPALV